MKGKKWGLTILTLAMVAVFVACSAAPQAASKASAPVGATSGKETLPQAAPGAQPAAGAPGSAAAPNALRVAPAAEPAKSADSNASSSASTASWDRMIIRNVTLSMVVKDVDGSIGSVRDIAGGVGGFVAQSSSRYDGEFQLATITIQVPSERFDSVVESLRRLAVKVESENGTSQDVTEEYSDLDAQVRNLQATEASLQRLMDKATRMEDILALQRELTNVRGQIERLQGRMKYLSRRADMATITVSLRPEGMVKPKPEPQPLWRPFETARNAWAASSQVLLGIADVLITLVVFFWWLIPVAVLVAYLLRHRSIQRRPETTPGHGANG